MKKGVVAFVLWLFCLIGVCGLHRFYLNRPWTGILWLLTFGLLGIGQLIDLFLLGSMVRQENLMMSVGGLNISAHNTNTVAPIFNVHLNVPSDANALETLKLS
jgi:TM2 domain-containing membrane protein YozV